MIANLIKVKNIKKALNNDKVMTFALRFSYSYFFLFFGKSKYEIIYLMEYLRIK